MDGSVFVDTEFDFAAKELRAQLTGLSPPRRLTFKFEETTFKKSAILDLIVSQLSTLTLSTSQTRKIITVTDFLIPALMNTPEYHDHLRLFEVFTQWTKRKIENEEFIQHVIRYNQRLKRETDIQFHTRLVGIIS